MVIVLQLLLFLIDLYNLLYNFKIPIPHISPKSIIMDLQPSLTYSVK